MPFHWSENTKIGLQFLPAWSTNCAIPEQEINSAEKKLNLKFPQTLRNFYLDWGNHKELTSTTDSLIYPSKCWLIGYHLIFAIENQSVIYWSININELHLNIPPVYFAYNDFTPNKEKRLAWKLVFPTVSDFLDSLLFTHAFHDESKPFNTGYSSADSFSRKIELIQKLSLNHIQLQIPPWGRDNDNDVKSWDIYYDAETLVTFIDGLWFKSMEARKFKLLENDFEIHWDYSG